jgi:hypothetical protein
MMVVGDGKVTFKSDNRGIRVEKAKRALVNVLGTFRGWVTRNVIALCICTTWPVTSHQMFDPEISIQKIPWKRLDMEPLRTFPY